MVANVLPGSTVTHPKIEIGKVIRIDREKTRLKYLLFSHMGGNKYRCEVGTVRKATVDQCVHPVDLHYNPDDNTYQLRCTLTEIHLNKNPLT